MNSNLFLYHFVSINRLKKLARAGLIPCDADRNRLDGFPGADGGPDLKRRFVRTLNTAPDKTPAEFVRFFFGSHPLLMRQIEFGRRPEEEYRSGGDTMLRLVTTLGRLQEFARTAKRRYAFTDGNSGSAYFRDYADAPDGEAETEQEFLLEGFCPFQLIQEIQASTEPMANAARDLLQKTFASGIPVVVRTAGCPAGKERDHAVSDRV